VGQRLILPVPGTPAALAVAAREAPQAVAGSAPAVATTGGSAPQPAPATQAPASSPATVAAAPVLAAAPSPPAGQTVRPTGLQGPVPTVSNLPAPGAAPRASAPAAVAERFPSAPDPALTALVPVGDFNQALMLESYDATRHEGRVHTAYGETVGHYADWALVPAREIRRVNGLAAGQLLQPGRALVIPLSQVTPDAFLKQREQFHRNREISFYAAYTVKEKLEVQLHRGQSLWTIAQTHNVPMWLLYRENPALMERPAQAGTKVIVPLVEEQVPAANSPAPGSVDPVAASSTLSMPEASSGGR
jgi:LysM repeat protein